MRIGLENRNGYSRRQGYAPRVRLAAAMATTTATDGLPSVAAHGTRSSLLAQVRTFLWVSSGMFSSSSLALAFLDWVATGSVQQANTHFLAAVIAAGLFGVATYLKLGPDEA